jgi:hypothetical protein
MTNAITLDRAPDRGPKYRLRDDLVFADRDERGRVVVKDPRNQKMYGFSSTVCDAIRLLDGNTYADELPDRLQQRIGQRISQKSAHALVEQARSLGLFDGALPDAPPPETVSSTVTSALRKFNPLYIRIKAFDPQALLRPLDKLFFPLFTRGAALVFLALVVLSITAIVLDGRRYGNSFMVFLFFKHWVLAWALLVAAGVVHELGHATACRRFGGNVREVGLLLYVFQPGLYTNVNDAWLMPRRQRITVSLAGVYVEGFLWCLCVGVWAFARPFSTASQVTFVLSVVLGSRIFLNLFPFLRLDGYFVLADLVGIPNLRPKSLVYVVSWLPWLGRGFRGARPPVGRERVILALYGVASYVSLVYVLSKSVGMAHQRLGHGWLFWLLTMAVVPMACLAAYTYVRKHRPTA